jgi:hypothetical protein
MAGKTRRIARIGAVVGIAAATGYFMQSDRPSAQAVAAAPVPGPAVAPMPPSDATRAAAAAAAPAAVVPPVAGAVASVTDVVAAPPPDAPPVAAPPADALAGEPADAAPPASSSAVRVADILRTSTLPAVPVRTGAGGADAVFAGATSAAAAEPAPAEASACVEALDVVAAPGAMLTLVLTAPCRAGERVVLRHAGLAVTAQTTAAGTLTAAIPAFDPAGAVAVQFPDGHRAEGAAPVGDLAGIARFAVQWMAGDRFHINAFAPGATFGDAGHVHAGAPGSRGGAAGYILSLGDATLDRALLAEVYTFPADRAAVTLELEAPIDAATCGRDILGETLQWADGSLTLRDLAVEMPDCGTGDGFLLLQNPMADLKLAAN